MTYKSKTTDMRDTELSNLFDDWLAVQPEDTQTKIDGWIDRILEACHAKGQQISPRGAKVAIAHTLARFQPVLTNEREK